MKLGKLPQERTKSLSNKIKKRKQNITVSFIDEPAATGVTGSLVYVETPKHKILLDAGFYQSNDTKEDYDINNRIALNYP